MTTIWLAAIVLLVAVEALTMVLTTIWFAVGALLGLICSLLGASFQVQFGVFLVGSTASIFVLRPIATRLLRVGGERTNADRVVGETGLVTLTIDNIAEQGLVHICGQTWTARSVDGALIEVGEQVTAVRISGVKLYVARKEKASTLPITL